MQVKGESRYQLSQRLVAVNVSSIVVIVIVSVANDEFAVLVGGAWIVFINVVLIAAHAWRRRRNGG